jgi:hypothetical protein
LFLPESWTNDPQRLAEAGVPEEVKFREKWELALEMIGKARGWDLTGRIVGRPVWRRDSISGRTREA